MCQSPSHWGTHFYRVIIDGDTEQSMCQSPSHRGTHFYYILLKEMAMCDDCVNPLLIRELISTYDCRRSRVQSRLCQSPSHRGTHFYKEWYLSKWWGQSVNPLLIGELISTAANKDCTSINELCVNPLLIGELISTTPHPVIRVGIKVSIPFSSGNSFLLYRKENCIMNVIYCVNPLLIGELISTPRTDPKQGWW